MAGYSPSIKIGCANHPKWNCIALSEAPRWSALSPSTGSAQSMFRVIPTSPFWYEENWFWYNRYAFAWALIYLWVKLHWMVTPVLSYGPLPTFLKPYLVVSGYINRLSDAFQPWSVFSIPMATDWRHPRLVQCYPHLDLFKKCFSLRSPVASSWCKSNLIAEFLEAHSGILFEPECDVWIEPSAAILQGLGEIPVVECDCGCDTLSFQSRDQILVVLDGNKCDELIVGQEYR